MTLSLRCPESMRPHVAEVLAGCYDAPGIEFATPPRVLDIGANIGAFAVWAMHRWPGCRVDCYEPNPEAVDLLMANVPQAQVHPVAVTGKVRPFLRFGRNNLGEASLHYLGEQVDEGVEVHRMAPGDLPPCDVLKVDTEGCEREIVCAALGPARPRVVAFEFHSRQDRLWLDDSLVWARYTLVRGSITRPDRGTLVYVREP